MIRDSNWEMIASVKKLLLPFLFLAFSQSLFSQNLPAKNWIAIYIWDSFTPLTLDRTVPEMLISLEVIFHQHAAYSANRELFRKNTPYGNRSTEGHYMVWIHVDDDFYSRNLLQRTDLPEKVYMFQDRETDIFTAWCGQANFRDFILDGVSGMANKTIFNNGSVSGGLDVFSSATYQGDAEYGAGFYLNDIQMLNALRSIMEYPGFEKGYSFISQKENRPEQDAYEPEDIQAVNGYNCNDFAFYLLDKAGIMPKKVSEKMKVDFWYPETYWDNTIPLKGSGARIYDAFSDDRSRYMGRDEILKLAWTELFFSSLDIFDEKEIVSRVINDSPTYKRVRVWDQLTMIDYLKDTNNRDFKAKLVMEELKPAIEQNQRLDSPEQEVSQKYNYRETSNYRLHQRKAARRTRKKIRKAGLKETELKEFQEVEKTLKRH